MESVKRSPELSIVYKGHIRRETQLAINKVLMQKSSSSISYALDVRFVIKVTFTDNDSLIMLSNYSFHVYKFKDTLYYKVGKNPIIELFKCIAIFKKIGQIVKLLNLFMDV